MLRRKNVISGCVIFLISLVLFAQTFTIRLTNIDKIVGSRLFPQIVLGLLMVFSLWLALADGISFKRGAAADPAGAEGRSGQLKVLAVFLALAVYISLLESAGFMVATVLYLFSQMYLLESGEKKRCLLYAFVSAAAAGAIFLVFTRGFHLVLPRGRLF